MRDDDLLRFGESRLGEAERARAEAALRRFGPAFRFQLIAAKHLEGWADREERAHEHLISFDERHKGYVDALREVAAHLRQGDYLPGGLFYEETERWSRPGDAPEPSRPPERRSGFDRRRGGDRRRHSTAVTVERRRGGRRVEGSD